MNSILKQKWREQLENNVGHENLGGSGPSVPSLGSEPAPPGNFPAAVSPARSGTKRSKTIESAPAPPHKKRKTVSVPSGLDTNLGDLSVPEPDASLYCPTEMVTLYDRVYQVTETELIRRLRVLDESETIFQRHFSEACEVGAEVGMCAADLVWRRALKRIDISLPSYSEEDNDDEDDDGSPENISRTQAKMRDTIKNWAFTMPNLDPNSRGFNVTPKFLRLVQILKSCEPYGEEFRGIIFVQRRAVAFAISDLIPMLGEHVGLFVHTQSRTTRNRCIKHPFHAALSLTVTFLQQEIFRRFELGLHNLLVATKSIEDLDLPKATMRCVICVCSSRTKGKGSHLVHMLERNSDVHRRILFLSSAVPPRPIIAPHYSEDSDAEDAEEDSTTIKEPIAGGRCVDLAKLASWTLNSSFYSARQSWLPRQFERTEKSQVANGAYVGVQIYPRKKPDFWSNPAGPVTTLYPTVIVVEHTDQPPHAPMLLLTRHPLAKLPSFKLFFSGSPSVIQTYRGTPFTVDDEKTLALHIVNKPFICPLADMHWTLPESTGRWNLVDVVDHIPWNLRETKFGSLLDYCKAVRKDFDGLKDEAQAIVEISTVMTGTARLDPASRPVPLSGQPPPRYLIPELCFKFTIPARYAISAPSNRIEYDYERLELLGDSFLKFLSSIYVFVNEPLACLVQAKHFGPKSWQPPNFRISEDPPTKAESSKLRRESEQRLGDKVVADVAEAILGAAYLSGGSDVSLKAAKAMNLPFPNVEQWSDFGRKLLIPPPTITAKLKPGALEAVETIVKHKFKHPHLLAQALTHSSVSAFERVSYERLEFIGDAILDFLVIQHIFDRNPKLTPGGLTMLKVYATFVRLCRGNGIEYRIGCCLCLVLFTQSSPFGPSLGRIGGRIHGETEGEANTRVRASTGRKESTRSILARSGNPQSSLRRRRIRYWCNLYLG
ncbi:hypothetical protein B0H10DRAFT_2140601 [Mycena sp. CBHHK59/15]|nr:hypothetical protein B0H10DRAFT_2140601 [Mycena sp. CBHHK59/15]